MSNGQEKNKVLSTLSPDVKEFTPKHNQSLDVNKLGQFSNLSPDVPEFVPSKHLAGTSGPHQVNLNTDQHRCVAGNNSWGGSASLTEERAVGNSNNAEEMPSRTVAGRKSYKKEREHIASGEYLASRKKKGHFKTTSFVSRTTYRHPEAGTGSDVKSWRRENQNSESVQGVSKNRTTAWAKHVMNDDKSLASQLTTDTTPDVPVSKQRETAAIKDDQSYRTHRQSGRTNLLSGESCFEGRQIYEKGKTKGQHLADIDGKLDLQSDSTVEHYVKNPNERNATWKKEKSSKEINSQQINDLNVNLSAQRQNELTGRPIGPRGHQNKMKEHKEAANSEPTHQTLDRRRRTGETVEIQATHTKQNIPQNTSKKRKKLESNSWFEEKMETSADQSFAKEKYSYQRDQLKLRIAEKDGWSFGDKNFKGTGEARIRLLQHQPAEATPEFTNEDFPDIGAQSKANNKSSDEESSWLPITNQRVPTVSYSAALRAAPRPKPRPAWQVQQGHMSANEDQAQPGMLKLPIDVQFDKIEEEEKKKKKKKRKKKSKEQDRETEGAQPKQSGKRAALPIQFDLGEILASAIKTAPKEKSISTKVTVATGGLPKAVVASPDNKMKVKTPAGPVISKQQKTPHNVLDSTAPIVKRGKERETPAKKKPSAMKKEREERKKARENQHNISKEDKANNDETITEPVECNPSATNCDLKTDVAVVGDDEVSSLEKEVASQIHSRRFRDYCDQVLNKEVDELVSVFLKELVRFQDRQYHKDPVKAKAKRRLVMGIREVTKHLKLKKIKCLIISPNVERIKSQGGLDDALRGMTNLCHEYNTPVVFALKRQALGRVVCKKVPVSVVGVFNYDGAQEYFKRLMEMTEKARNKYTEMRRDVEKEIQERLREKLENVEQSHFEQDEESLTGQVRPEAAGGNATNTVNSMGCEDTDTEGQKPNDIGIRFSAEGNLCVEDI